MVTTREAAHVVRLNRDWQAKYRQRAQQFLLSTNQQHQGIDCKLHEVPAPPPPQEVGDGDSEAEDVRLETVQPLQEVAIPEEGELTTVPSDEDIRLEALRLQQAAVSENGELQLSDKESESGDEDLQLLHQQNEEALSGYGEPLSLCIVGRSGIGKASLINHLLQDDAAKITPFEGHNEERTFDCHGLFLIREIPAYDGWHFVASHRERLRRRIHDSTHSSHSHHRDHGSTHSHHGSSHGHSHHGDSNHGSSHGHRSHHGSSHGHHGSSHGHHSRHGSHSRHSSDGSNDGSDSRHSSGGGTGKLKQLKLDDFVEMYGLFEAETKAIIFVVDSSITPEDHKLIKLAIKHRKYFCIVCTHADHLVKISDDELQTRQTEALEEQLRRDLSLIQTLNMRVFILSIPFPEGQAEAETLEGPNLKLVMQNIQSLHFPLLKSYLFQTRGLLDELQIHGFVKEEVWKALEPFMDVKKRKQALDFTEHLVAGTLLPIVGPVMVSFTKALCYTLKACSEVGLIEDGDDAARKVAAEANKHGLAAKFASKEGLVTAVEDSLIHIFGKVVFHVAIEEVAIAAAETALAMGLPLIAPVISAAQLPHRFKKIARKLGSKACMLHELWVMQNVTGLLEKAE